MRKTVSVIAALCLLATVPARAQDPQPRVHVVSQGETLWDIAQHYLNDPFLWPEIFRLNVDVVEDPALIFPNERLVLPDMVRTAGDFGPGQEDTGPRVRLAPQRQVTAVLQGDFYRAGFIARDGEVRTIGRLAEPEFESVLELRMPPQINLYDRVFVRVNPEAVAVGDRLHFVRVGREIPRLGRVYRPTGVGTVAALDGDVATVVVVGLYGQLEPGDVAITVDRFTLVPGVEPRAVAADLQGRILAFQDQRPLQMTESILFLDIGREAGVAVGDVFEAYTPPEQRDWGRRPEVSVARMQVVRVMGSSASVRVTQLEQPAIAVGLPVRRVARMP